MNKLVNDINKLSLEELERLHEVLKLQIDLKKQIKEIEEGRIVKLKQGKRQPIVMKDLNGNVVREFKGFNECASFLREEWGILNEQNKLRRVLKSGKEINNHQFWLVQR